MSETRKLAAILAADVVGYGRLAGADEERTLARLRALRGDLIDPAIAAHRGRVVKRTGDGALVEFRSVVDAVRCAVEIQDGMAERNAGLPQERRIEFRIGVHLGDVVEEADGDLMGDGVNITARLEGLAEPGGVCLSEDAYRQVRDRLKHPFVDLGERELKNIARPVRIYAIRGGSESARLAPSAPAPSTVASTKQEPPHLSVVVLPFTNMTGDPEQDYFVDGVTESLTTDLSRVRGSFVIGRNTAFTYKGRHVDLKQIGRELNVRYVLEGSVQRTGARMRVSVQLIDAESGHHLWAERFDKPLTDLFDMQDEIIARVAAAFRIPIVAAEARRAERVTNPDAMDLYFQGCAWLNKGIDAGCLTKARDYFERALALDPDNVGALVGMASVDAMVGSAYYSTDQAARLAAAEAAVSKALSLAPEDADARGCLSTILMFTNRPGQAIAEFEKALALNRNNVWAHANIGFAKTLVGRAEDAEGHIREALRLSSHDPSAYAWFHTVGAAKLCLGRDEEAVAWLRRSIDANRNFALAHFFLAAALAHLGGRDEARSAARTGLALNPIFTISRYRAGAPSKNPTFLAQRERIYDGLRKAGVPEE